MSFLHMTSGRCCYCLVILLLRLMIPLSLCTLVLTGCFYVNAEEIFGLGGHYHLCIYDYECIDISVD